MYRHGGRDDYYNGPPRGYHTRSESDRDYYYRRSPPPPPPRPRDYYDRPDPYYAGKFVLYSAKR